MAWKAYQVSFRSLSPMHIGWRKLGNLQQTRPYVTGRTLWGALTARLTRESGRSDYSKVGEQVDLQLAFTYFYPSTNPTEVALWPWMEWDKFAWMFLGSYASTSLGNGHNAEDGSLHETEFIAPYTRENRPRPVYLVGYIFEKNDYSIKSYWQDVLNKLQFGGERGYGWGRVRLEGKCKPVTDDNCFGYKLDCTGDYPVVSALQNDPLLAHAIASDGDCVGTIEPLVGRETTDASRHGRNLSQATICWVPGSRVTEKGAFQIQQKGVWTRLLN